MLKSALELFLSRRSIIFQVVAIILIICAMWVLFRVNRIVFERIKKKQRGIHIVFFERINKAIILIGGRSRLCRAGRHQGRACRSDDQHLQTL